MAEYKPSEAMKKQIEQTFHPSRELTIGQQRRVNNLRTNAKAFAADIAEMCPPSREQSLALTKLDEAVMMAVAAIARHESETPA